MQRLFYWFSFEGSFIMQDNERDFFEHHRIQADPKQQPCRLDLFLTQRLAGVSRTRIQAGIRQGGVHVNARESTKANYLVKPKDVIQIFLPTPPRLKKIEPEKLPLDIVYEDADLLVVNKAAEMVVHPGTGNWNGTLVHGLCYYFQNLPFQTGNDMRPGLVHRLDQGTSGLLVIAKTEDALSNLASQFARHSTKRTYWALVWGSPKEDVGTIDLAIGRSLRDRRVMQVYKDGNAGKHAITHYRVLERLGEVTLVTCNLETGRTHQIRIHMKALGHPLLGDKQYGGAHVVKGNQFSKYRAFVKNCFRRLPHQALHARSLGFIHPRSKEEMHFEVPVHDAFAGVLEKWRRRARLINAIEA